MKLKAQILNSKIKIKFKNKSVKYHNVKIGKITNSYVKDEQLWINVSIYKKFVKKIKKLLTQPNIISAEFIKGD